MSGISYHGFRGAHTFGHLSVYTDADGSVWARITVNGVQTAYEQIDSPLDHPVEPTDVQPEEVTPALRLPTRW